MTATLRLPGRDGTRERYTLRAPVPWPRPAAPITSRVAFAAAHVVPDPLGENVPGAPASLDWDQTLAVRRFRWSYGLGVAEAMDTAQRGMGLDWPATRELIARTAADARASGAGWPRARGPTTPRPISPGWTTSPPPTRSRRGSSRTPGRRSS